MAQEWRRLQTAYAEMSEEELEAVADDGFELTDMAKQALNAEILKRGLQVVVRLTPPEEKPEPAGEFDPATLDLSTALSVHNRDEAERVRTTLNDAGIPCFFGPQLADDLDQLEYPEHGAAVRVLSSDVKRARKALHDFLAELHKKDEGEPAVSEFAAHCPKCHSTEIVLQALATEDEDPGDDSDQEEKAAPDGKFHWSCDACGYQWTDDGVEKES